MYRSSRFALAREILKKNRIEVVDWEEFRRLLEILAGYPLAMEIILPNLEHCTAKELLEILTGAGVDMQGGRISKIHRQKRARTCCALRVAGKRGRTLKS